MRALLVVNPKATATTVAAPATCSRTPWPARPGSRSSETKARGHARRAGARRRSPTGSTSSSPSAATAPSTRWSTACCADGPRPGLPGAGRRARAAAPTCSPARSGCPRTRWRRPACCSRRCAASAAARIGLGTAERDGERRWFTFNAGLGLDAAVVRRVDARRASGRVARRRRCSSARASASSCCTPTGGAPGCVLERPGAEPERLGPRAGVQRRPLDLPRRPAGAAGAAGVASTPGWTCSACARSARCARCAHLAQILAADPRPARAPGCCRCTTPTSSCCAPTARSRCSSTARTSATADTWCCAACRRALRVVV